MSLAPRVVIVHRRTEYEQLLQRHGSRGQAAFFLETRGRAIHEVELRHEAVGGALATVTAAIPLDWRRGSVEREDLSRFLFAPDDVVVVVGQDGLVANVAKYLDGQPVIGIDPEPGRNAGVLVTHRPAEITSLLHRRDEVEHRTMVAATLDDGQRLLALNEVFVGHPSHQTARWTLTLPDGRREAQASSGLIAATGTGATGWCASAALERHSNLAMPAPDEPRLAWFVREAWPSPATGTSLTEGDADPEITVASDRLVAFGDGIESDALTLSWGQTVRISVADRTLHLVR
ncbi:NAD(+)/NADH kinase [Jatrophihabitans fulvus]